MSTYMLYTELNNLYGFWFLFSSRDSLVLGENVEYEKLNKAVWFLIEITKCDITSNYLTILFETIRWLCYGNILINYIFYQISSVYSFT